MNVKNCTLSKYATKEKYVYHCVGTQTTFVYHVELYKFDMFNFNKIVRSVYIRMTEDEFNEACREVVVTSLRRNIYSNWLCASPLFIIVSFIRMLETNKTLKIMLAKISVSVLVLCTILVVSVAALVMVERAFSPTVPATVETRAERRKRK